MRFVDTDHFLRMMEEHWTRYLNNPSSDMLRAIWRRMSITFNGRIIGDNALVPWEVLKPETGTGKTQGLAVYCSMLSREDHPGVLIATRFKAEADELASIINDGCGWEMASACHSDRRLSFQEKRSFPVLVVTHEAYKTGIDLVNDQNEVAWAGLSTWQDNRPRRLIVVDEAINFVQETSISAQQIDIALACIPRDVRRRFPEQIALARSVQAILEGGLDQLRELEGRGAMPRVQERMLWKEPVAARHRHDMSGLIRELRAVRFDQQIGGKRGSIFNGNIKENVCDTLLGLQSLVSGWAYLAKQGKGETLNTARFILPEGITGAVVLDATASSDRLYEIFPGGCTIHHTEPARRYDNVTLHVSRGHRVGKRHLAKNASKLAPMLIGSLRNVVPQDRRVLLICHKAVEPWLAGYAGQHFDAFELAHWGALDGRNAWRDFDTAVLFGLPYPPTTYTANVFMAMQGPQDDEWLSDGTKRKFANFSDIRAAIEESHIVRSVIQGINRVRCRRVIDEHGGCAPVDIYALLPEKRLTDHIIKALRDEMPGIQIVEKSWFDGNKVERPRGRSYEAALISYLANMPSGEVSASDVKQVVGGSLRTWATLSAQIREPGTALHVIAERHGARYEVRRRGKTNYAYLIKD
jgi:hypothetical protein